MINSEMNKIQRNLIINLTISIFKRVMSDFYQQLCNMLIRPTRQTYHLYDLGNPLISNYGKRQDFQILSRNNNKLKCSFYHCTHQNVQNSIQPPVVIYLHSLNGSRLQFLANIEPLLKMGYSISTLDFIGCGLSDGSYVTLGAHEKFDVLQLVKYIYRTYGQSNFIIWGRSMGAVAAIKFYSLLQDEKQTNREMREIKILGLVLDSPFCSLNQLAVQIAKNRINIPEIVIKMAFYMIQSSIENRANFKTSELQLENQVKKICCPTLIITSKRDTLVPYEHSLTIYNNIAFYDKQLMYIETEHNTNREESDIQKVYQFLQEKSKNFSSGNTYFTGSVDRNSQKLKSRSVKRKQTLTLSKEKLHRNQSQKNNLSSSYNPYLFFSHAAQKDHIRIQNSQQSTPNQGRVKEFSVDKVIAETNNQHQTTQDQQSANQSNQNRIYFSADRPKIFFVNQMQQSCANYNSLQKQPQKLPDFNASLFASIPEPKFNQKHLNHSSSYKNIECLKTVKKIKRLQPQLEQQGKQQKQKQDITKSHMNVITAKLKKKSKNILTKSFFPHDIVQNEKESMISCEKTLRRQSNARSSTVLEYSYQNKGFIKNTFQKPSRNQKPVTPSCFSNRDIMFNQKIQKPFTPQIPLHSSMRINEMSQRREASRQEMFKMYSVHSINENSRGIKTTLNINYNSSNNQNRGNQILSQSLGQHYEIPRPEFMSCKNTLSSQVINMRAETNVGRNKKFIVANKRVSNDPAEDTSISLK